MARAHGDDDREEKPADEAALAERLQRLGERLGPSQSDRASEGNVVKARPPRHRVWRVACGCRAEFVAGILLGAAIGWLIDRLLGTSPWGLIVFLLLGFAAGVLNVARAAGAVQPNRLDPPGSSGQR